ncbi:MAG: class I SAM-dependent methyltransferase [Candidatus Omnitrophota bacterium]
MLKKFLERHCPFLFSQRTYLAFGVEESPNKYPLDKARYVLMASCIHEEYMRQKKPIKVLDIGCHEGMMILYCRKNNSEVEFYGMDILQERLNKALGRGYKSALIQDIRSRPFPYKDDFFDVVISSHILEHLERPGEVLGELNRVMKKGAVLLVGVPIGILPAILWRRYITPLYDKTRKPQDCLKRFGHVSFFTLARLKKLLKDHGFVTEDARGDYFIRSRRFFLENYKWWFDFNQLYGRIFPGITGHVTVKSRLTERKNYP